ncbi:MAG: diguanylate cyclase [Paracoccaceae bacterium]
MAGKILIVDDVATNRIVLTVKLAAACYGILQAETGHAALRTARESLPDLILLDVMLPDLDGVEVCRRLKADPLTREIPIVMITAFSDAAARMQALAAGADDFLSKPLDDLMLLARLRSLLRARETADELRLRDTICRELGFAEAEDVFEGPGLIGVIAADPIEAQGWCDGLAPHLAHRLSPMARADALTEGAGPVPDVFLIAGDMAMQSDGLRLMSELRSRPATRHAAVCMILPAGQRETAAIALDLGANDLVSANVDPQECALRLTSLLRRKRQSDLLRATLHDGLRLSVTDVLTGLYNRRYALPHLTRVDARAGETGRSCAVLLIDIDHFKDVNDTWGHAAGDAVLVTVAERLRDNLRGADLVARIGGEEFLVVMPEASLAEASGAAERLRRILAAQPVQLPGGRGEMTVTISVGVALGGDRSRPETGAAASGQTPAQRLLDHADAALLRAKATGRNRVCIAGPGVNDITCPPRVAAS